MKYSDAEIERKLKTIKRHLTETANDIIGYYSEIKIARRINEVEYEKDCRQWLKVLNNTYRYLLVQYNYYQALI